MLSVPPIWMWMSALQPIKTSYEIFCASAPSFVIWYNIASYLGIIRIKGGNSRDSNFLLSQFLSVTSWKYFSCWLWNCVCIVSQALPHPVADSLGLSQCQLGFLIPGPVMPLPGPQVLDLTSTLAYVLLSLSTSCPVLSELYAPWPFASQTCWPWAPL